MLPENGPVWGPGPTVLLPIKHPVGPDPQIRPFLQSPPYFFFRFFFPASISLYR